MRSASGGAWSPFGSAGALAEGSSGTSRAECVGPSGAEQADREETVAARTRRRMDERMERSLSRETFANGSRRGVVARLLAPDVLGADRQAHELARALERRVVDRLAEAPGDGDVGPFHGTVEVGNGPSNVEDEGGLR